jgi:hypothetical protein
MDQPALAARSRRWATVYSLTTHAGDCGCSVMHFLLTTVQREASTSEVAQNAEPSHGLAEGGRIRTSVTVARKARQGRAAFDRSATPPTVIYHSGGSIKHARLVSKPIAQTTPGAISKRKGPPMCGREPFGNNSPKAAANYQGNAGNWLPK